MAVRPVGQRGRRPAVEVQRVAADEDHAVDRRRTAKHPATVLVAAVAVQARLGLALEAPVETLAFQGQAQGGGHLQDHAIVARPGLQQQDPGGAFGAEAVGHHAPRRPGTDHDVIELVLAHLPRLIISVGSRSSSLRNTGHGPGTTFRDRRSRTA